MMRKYIAQYSKFIPALYSRTKRDRALIALFALLFVIVLAGNSYAGTTGTEFQGAYALISGWTTGFLGKIIALTTFLVGLAGTIIRQNLYPVVVGLAVALTVALGPSIIEAIATATF